MNDDYTGWARDFGKWHYFKNGKGMCKRTYIHNNSEFYDSKQSTIYENDICGWCKRYLKDDSIWGSVIKEKTPISIENSYTYNFDLLLKLTRDIPSNLDRSVKKESITPEIRKQLVERDQNICQICGLKDQFGNPGWDIPGKLAAHHIIPNGEASLDNIITLCRYCHNAVHAILYASGKWRYVPMR